MKTSVLSLLAVFLQFASHLLRAATDPVLPAVPVITVTASRPSTAEGESEPALFTIKRTGSSDVPLLVFYRTSGTAAIGSDYETLPGSVSIPARASSVEVRVRAIDDRMVEEDETVVLTVTSSFGPLNTEAEANAVLLIHYQIGDPSAATVTIKDNDRLILPTVVIRATASEASEEGPKSGHFTVTRTGSTSGDLTVEYQIVTEPLRIGPIEPNITPNGVLEDAVVAPVHLVKAAENGVDYKQLSGSVTIPSGESSARISVDPIDDTLVEGTEHVTLRVRTVARYSVNAPTSATVLIADNDPAPRPPVVTIVASVPETPESSDPSRPGVFKISRTGSTATKLNVHYTIGGTALNGIDYSELPRVVTILAGEESAAIFVKPVPDKALEGNETVILTLTQLVFIQRPPLEDEYTVGEPKTARVTIVEGPNTSQPPKVEITKPASGATFPEHATVEIEGVASDADGYITGVELFINEVHHDGLILILPPEAPGRGRIEFKFQWKDVRVGEYLLVAKTTDNSGLSSRSEPVKVFVRNVNTRPVVTIVAADAEASERDPQNTGTFVVSRTGSTDGPLHVFYAVGGTAKEGSDYEKLLGAVEIAKGEKSARIVVKAIADNAEEERETVIVRLVSPPVILIFPPVEPSYVVGDPASATVFIIDGDSRPLAPKIAIDSPKNGDVFNEHTTIKVEVQAADADGYITKVDLFANDRLIGTETRHYLVRPPDGQIARFTFEWKLVPAGEYTLVAKATDDDGLVGASSPVKIVVRGLTQDPRVTITAPDLEASEADPSDIGVFRIHRSGPTTKKLSVFYSITGTAENGVDYQRIQRSVTIPEGQEAVRISVEAIEDRKREGRETVTLTLVELLAIDPPLDQFYRTAEPRSATVVIIDGEDTDPAPFVRRELPDTYTPGAVLKVVLEAAPGNNVQVYAVEDHPPRGWRVGAISHEGIYDSANHKVKFGPFFDNRARAFTYEVTPPSDESGPEEFSGIASANGHDTRIGGDHVITNGRLHHPADNDPADFAIRIGELTAYAFAWKTGHEWPVPPNPIPQSYVTRAGEIWRKGETYHFNPAAGPPPLWWVPGPALRALSMNDAPAAEAPTVEEARAFRGRVTRVFTSRDSEPGSYLVLITVMPKSGVSAYTVEEQLPDGWVASEVSDEGHLNAAQSTIRWGIFLDDQVRTLKYRVRATANVTERVAFVGAASFDGIDVPIHTQLRPNPGEGNRSGLLERVHRHDSGDVEVVLTGEIGRRYRIQASANLMDWEDIGAVLTDNGEIEIMDAKAAELPTRYYRAVLDE